MEVYHREEISLDGEVATRIREPPRAVHRFHRPLAVKCPGFRYFGQLRKKRIDRVVRHHRERPVLTEIKNKPTTFALVSRGIV